MGSCLIIGDSIALGIAAALAALQPDGCEIRARIGASVAAIIKMVPADHYHSVIISAGSNSRDTVSITRDLVRLRRALSAGLVTWVYPRSVPKAWEIYRVALKQGDRTVSVASLPSRDGVHPDNYEAVVQLVWPQPFRPRAASTVRKPSSQSTSQQISKRDLPVK